MGEDPQEREGRDLRARLHALDPVASDPAADPDRVARLLEDVMSHDTTTESRATGTRRRSRLTWAVAGAAAAVIVAVGTFALVDRGGDGVAPAAQPTPTGSASTPTGPTVTELTLPDGPQARATRCMVPSPETLGTAAYALAGEVASVEAGTVTLEVTEWYAGGPTDRVEVDQSSADLTRLVGAPRFEPGGRYLVAGDDSGDLLVCGFSARYSGRLARLYEQAFPS